MADIVIDGVRPYDGRYELPLSSDDELTSREFGWIKRLAGTMPLEIVASLRGGDAELICVLAAIALQRAGKIDRDEVPEVFDRLLDAGYGSKITLDAGTVEEADAGPPVLSSNSNSATSGPGSKRSSSSDGETRAANGTPGSGSSALVPTRLVS